MAVEKSKVLIQFLVIFRQFGDVLSFLYARRLRGYTATTFEELFSTIVFGSPRMHGKGAQTCNQCFDRSSVVHEHFFHPKYLNGLILTRLWIFRTFCTIVRFI